MLAVECSEITGVLLALSVPALKPLFDTWLVRLGVISTSNREGSSSYFRSGGGFGPGPSSKSRARYAGSGAGGWDLRQTSRSGIRSSRPGDGDGYDTDDMAIVLVKPNHAYRRDSRDKPLPAAPGYFAGTSITNGSSEEDLFARGDPVAAEVGKYQTDVYIQRSGSMEIQHEDDLESGNGIKVTKNVSVVSTRDLKWPNRGQDNT